MSSESAKDDVEEKPKDAPKSKEAAKAAAAASRITDYYHENEADTRKAAAAVASLSTANIQQVEQLYEGDIPETSIQCIMDECDMAKDQAEKWLRRHGGDLSTGLRDFIHQ